MAAGMDMEVRKMVTANMAARMTLHQNTTATAIDRAESGSLCLSLATKTGCSERPGMSLSEAEVIEVDTVLMAVGRSPRTENMCLEVRAHDQYSFWPFQLKAVCAEVSPFS